MGVVGRVGVVDSKEQPDSPLLISCRWARVRSRGLPRPRGVQFVCLAKADGVIMRTVVRMTAWTKSSLYAE